MEDGKRLENLSWRLWNRETFCCSPPQKTRYNLAPRAKQTIPGPPPLSSSVSSNDSDFDDEAASPPSPVVRPELRRSDSTDHRSRGHEKHITPIDLEKMVISIQEKKNLEPLPSLSLPVPFLSRDSPPSPAPHTVAKSPRATSVHASSTSLAPTTALPLNSSASDLGSNGSNPSGNMVSSESSSTEMSTHNIVRGFEPNKMSSYRSQTQLAAPPTPILKSSPQYRSERFNRPEAPAKKGAMFTLGGSSGEDESSLDSHMGKNSMSSLSKSIHKPTQKHTSFKDIVNSRAITESPVFEESDDEDDDDGYENVIEDDDDEEDEDSSDWEDDVGESGNSSSDEKGLFQRVDSRPNLASRRSMLTTMMHEPDRAKALANAASRSSPALRRSRQTSPNGPSATPPPRMQEYIPRQGPEPAKPQPIMVNTSSGQQLALSPRTTRRNMLSTELTESLRKNLLWERQHKSSNNLAAMKRRHTSHDVKNLKQHPEPQPIMSVKDNDKKNYSNDYFHQGLQEYHARGW